MIDQYETNSVNNESIDSGCSKTTASNIYEKNLQIINESVTEDKYKFMEDLVKEKQNGLHFGVASRSTIAKKAHTDAEEEFLLSVLSCKIDLATKGCSNASVSDVSPQSLWNTAQEQCIAMHQFHDWIMSHLLKVYQSTQNSSTKITHTWSSYESVIGDKLQDDPEKPWKIKNTKRHNIHQVMNGPRYDSPKQLQDEEQILTDDESDIDDEHEVLYQARIRGHQLI